MKFKFWQLKLLVVKDGLNTTKVAGVVRDMLQNHMLQVLSLITMEANHVV